ncbi:MAG: hypothetical protein QXH40_07225 [Candidatus Bathyarchaeia archaeon]
MGYSTDEPKKYPDEDEIERVLNRIYDVAWNNVILSSADEDILLKELKWVLDVWSKQYLGNDRLTRIINDYYLTMLRKSEDKSVIYKELDLVICFFQHYIYAFEEFMTREFRDSVIRCGLICERLVKRLAMAGEHYEVLEIAKFEDKVNKLISLLSNRISDIHFLMNRMKYIYSQRSRKGAHDTGAAGILIAKACISEIPITYMEYLETLESIGYKIRAKKELIGIVNDTVKVSTTMIITREGEPAKPESVLLFMYQQNYFAQPRTFSEVDNSLKNQRYNFPKSSLCKALDNLCKKKILTKQKRGIYVQRMPPEKYFQKEI